MEHKRHQSLSVIGCTNIITRAHLPIITLKRGEVREITKTMNRELLGLWRGAFTLPSRHSVPLEPKCYE
jgi:hypothetical protein